MKHFKSLVQTIFFLGATLSLTTATGAFQESIQEAGPSWKEAVQFAKEQLPLEGQLVRKVDGFVYLKVDDRYIHSLFAMLGLEGENYKEPPYFRSKDATGAHISVIYEDENIIPAELGQTFHFELKDIVIVQASKTALYAVLQVNSPELEQLRKKYGLSGKLHGHEFHIAIAKKTIPKKKTKKL